MKAKFSKSFNDRIYRPDWHSTRPLGIISESDIYYVQLSNKILSIFSKIEGGSLIPNKLNRDISVRLAAYFEDVISGLGLWKAFINIHHRMYGKYLPFYNLNTDEYIEDEINIEDIQFFIWAIVQQNLFENKEQRFINPENPFLADMATEIYTLLDSEYTTAPANDAIYRFIHQPEFEDDIISSREMLGWLHYDSYLSMAYPRKSLMEEIDGLKTGENRTFFSQNTEILTYAMEKIGIFSKTCSPIAIKAKDWAAQIFHGTPKANLFSSMDFRQIANYNIVQLDAETFTIVDADNEKYFVSVDSVSTPQSLRENKLMMCSLLYFNGLWHVNGFASFAAKQKNLNKLPTKNKARESNNNVYNHVLNELKEDISYYENSQNLRKALLSLFPLSDENKLIPSDFNTQNNFVLFVHPEIGLRIFPEIATQISDSRNPFYNIDDVEQVGLGLLTGYYELPKEFLEYLIDKRFLEDITLNSLLGRDYGKKQLQENIRFVVRFFQPYLYN